MITTIATESRWGRRILVRVGGGKRVHQINRVGSECAKATGRETKKCGRLVGIEGLPRISECHEKQAERHAKAEAKKARSQEVSHARSLRWYALADDVAWHQRNNDVAAEAGLAYPSPRAERPLVQL